MAGGRRRERRDKEGDRRERVQGKAEQESVGSRYNSVRGSTTRNRVELFKFRFYANVGNTISVCLHLCVYVCGI